MPWVLSSNRGCWCHAHVTAGASCKGTTIAHKEEWNGMTDVVDGPKKLGANRRLVNAKTSMLQEKNPDAACMCVHTSFGKYSDRHVL